MPITEEQWDFIIHLPIIQDPKFLTTTESIPKIPIPNQTSMSNSGGDQEDRIQENSSLDKPYLVYSRRPRDPQPIPMSDPEIGSKTKGSESIEKVESNKFEDLD